MQWSDDPDSRKRIRTKYMIQFPLLRPIFLVFKQIIFLTRILNKEEVSMIRVDSAISRCS